MVGGAGVLLLGPEQSELSWALGEGRQGFGPALNPQPYADAGIRALAITVCDDGAFILE